MKTDPSQDTWNMQWNLYNNAPYFKPNKKVLEEIQKCFNTNITGKKILEIGAGSGSDIVYLSAWGAEAYALDFSRESIRSIRSWSKKKMTSVQIVKADAKKIPYPDNKFDLVYSVGLMEHFIRVLPLLIEQIRVVKPGGFLIIDVPQKYTLYTIAKHVRMSRNKHPCGWETEYSKGDLLKLAQKLEQPVHCIYGRDSDIILKLPLYMRRLLSPIFSKTIEQSRLGAYVCLCIGLVLQIKK